MARLLIYLKAGEPKCFFSFWANKFQVAAFIKAA